MFALTQLMSTDDNVIGHAYTVFSLIFGELRDTPPSPATEPESFAASLLAFQRQSSRQVGCFELPQLYFLID